MARRINTQGFQHAVPEMAGSTDRDGAFAAEARPECTRPAHRASHPLQQSLPPCPLFGSLGCQLADHQDIVCAQQMLQYNPVKRISARQAMLHPYFADLDKSAYAHLEK